MTFTQDTRKELVHLLTVYPDWLRQLKWYGGSSSPVAFDRDWRINQGELFEAYSDLVDKLKARNTNTSVEAIEIKLTDIEIVTCGWFFKRHLRSPEYGLTISRQLAKTFYNIPNSARIKGQKLYLPFDSKAGHKLQSLFKTSHK